MFDEKKFKEKLGDNLLCAVKYGTEGETNNFMCVLEKLDFDVLQNIKEIVQKNKDKAVPLFFTRKELNNAADVFPLEFLDIKYPHELLYGKDLVNSIKFNKKSVRIQLESELRSKLIHLREAYVWVKKDKELKELILSSIPNMMPILYGFLFIKNIEPPAKLSDLLDTFSQVYKIDINILKMINNLRNHEITADKEDLQRITAELIGFLQKTVIVADKIRV